MRPEPLPCDRKDFVKERKHERFECLGSVARCRDSSHHGSREFNRWGSPDFRRPPGHVKQGGWHLFPEESGHGYALSRSSDKMLEEENCRPSVSRGDGKYGRTSRENRGSFNQRECRGHSWETTNNSLNLSRRPSGVINDQSSVDDMLAYSSHPHSDIVNTWDQRHLKGQQDKVNGVSGLGTGQRCDREYSLGSIDWKPLKWTRSGSLSSWGSGFSRSSSSRSMGVADSNEAKAELQPKNATALDSHSGDAAACVTSSAPSEETISRKKPRLNWGEGLVKYEKKKAPEASPIKDVHVLPTSNIDTCDYIGLNSVDKSPKVPGFSDCASPATPSSVACSSSPGVDDKLFGKAANIDNDVSNFIVSPGHVSQNHLQSLPFNLEKLDSGSLTSVGSLLNELLQFDDNSSLDSGLVRSASMNKLLMWKAGVSKVLEVTEAEIDSLETELTSLKSESRETNPCPALGSLLVGDNLKSCDEHVGVSDRVCRPVPLQIVSSADPDVEKMLLSTNLHSVNGKEEDIDSPGTATSKFLEPLPLIKASSSCDMGRHDNCPGELDVMQSTGIKCLVPSAAVEASVPTCDDLSMEVKNGMGPTSGATICLSTENILSNTIISANEESVNGAREVLYNLLPKDSCKIDNMRAASNLYSPNGLMKQKFEDKKQFSRLKERVITLKFKTLHHLWKEDMHLLSLRKCRLKSHKKLEVGIRTTCSGYQKYRSSTRSCFPCPKMSLSNAGNPNLIPSLEIINFTREVLSDSPFNVHVNTLKMPALILDEREKMISRFKSSNGLVEDPLAYEKERAIINPWTSEEKEIFKEKLATVGKDFRKIASFLDHKTTADCVEFYYKNHKSDGFEKVKQGASKQGKLYLANTDLMVSGKKWNSENNAASLEILSAASVMASHADGITGDKMYRGSFLLRGYGNINTLRGEASILKRSSSIEMLEDEREAVAADVLAGICGSFSSEPVSSCITNSLDPIEGKRDRKWLKVNPGSKQPLMPGVAQNVDDETSSDVSCGGMDPADWTDEEKSAFLRGVSFFGKDFVQISECVGTRSPDQCKVFFSKARKCLGLDLMSPMPENIGLPVNGNAKGGGSDNDTDDAFVVGTGSIIGNAKFGTETDEDLPMSTTKSYLDESNSVEPRNWSTDLTESKDNNGTDVDHEDAEDMDNRASDSSEVKIESKMGSGGDILSVYGKFDSVSGLTGSIRTSVSAAEIIEPCQSNSIDEAKIASSGDLGNELDGQKPPFSHFLDYKDDKDETNTGGVVVFEKSAQNPDTTVNASLSSKGSSCTGLSLDAEEMHGISLGKSHVSSLPADNPNTSANLLLQNASTVLCRKTVNQSQLPSTCDFQGNRDRHYLSSISNGNGDHQFHISGHLLDHVKAASILQGYPLQMPIKKEVNGDISCSSSAMEFPSLSQKIDQASDQYKSLLSQSLDSERTSRNGDVKLFGKILTNPSSNQKPNLSNKGCEENGKHHPKLGSKSYSRKCTGHRNAGGNSTILKFDQNDYLGVENVPMGSYGYWDGNKIQTGLSSLPDSAILLAKYPASSAKLNQQSVQALTKSNEQHLNGASAFVEREVNCSNGMLDYHMFRSREGPKLQSFMVGMEHCQDVFSETQKRNCFEAISSIQQQGKGMVGMNGVARPGVLVGGSRSSVSDPVTAIKKHYSNSDQRGGGQTGSIMGEDEYCWGGRGDLSR